MNIRREGRWGIVVAASIMAAGCEKAPAAGDPCPASKNGQPVSCESAGTVLLCFDNKLVAVPCRGPSGCTGADSPSCDMDLGKEGEACLSPRPDSAESACSEDKTHTLMCRGNRIPGRFETGRPCRGPKGCAVDGGVKCDQSAAHVGDRCLERENAFGVCSRDKKLLLECEDEAGSPFVGGGKFVGKYGCPTVKGCEMRPRDGVDSLEAFCDYGDPKPGAPCGKGYQNTQRCGEGKRTIVKCDSSKHTFELIQTCPEGETCQTFGGHFNIPTCAPPK